jgi:hypothetical protein
MDVDEAAELARTMLAEALPRRWRHVRSVARRARWVAKELSLSDDLVAAAWLHDIGYAPGLAETGFHPLDGARYLRRQGQFRVVIGSGQRPVIPQISRDYRQTAASDGIQLRKPGHRSGLRRVSELVFLLVAGPGFEPG